MPRKAQRNQISPKIEVAIEAFRVERQQKLDVIIARDAATPPWLLALRQYIDAAIAHYCAENERPEEGGYTSSDDKGRDICEALWTQVVTKIPAIPATHDDYRVLAEVLQETLVIGKRDDTRRERLCLIEPEISRVSDE